MGKSIPIKVEPAILKYARRQSGFEISEVAQKTKIRAEFLMSLENTKAEIPLAKLQKLAELYKRPLAYFLLEQIPKDVVLPKDFRIVYSSETTGFAPPVMLAIRKARYIQSVIQEIAEEKFEYNLKKVSISDNPEDVASYFRAVIENPEEEKRLLEPAAHLRYWKEKVEKLNIFVLQQSIPEEDVSAFCLADKAPYVVVLNSSEHPNRRIFSLFHEIGHILLHTSGICTPDNFSKNSFEYIKIEKFCNQFAASLLVPYEEFVKDSLVEKIRKMPFDEWDSNDVRIISTRFRVSQEVIYRRLVSIGVITNAQYEQKRSELIKGFEEYKKRQKPKILKIPQFRKIISSNGIAYASFILDKLHSHRITMADAADYLGTSSKHIFEVEAHI